MLRNNSNTGKIEARGSGREEQPHAERAQEGIEGLSHIEGQEGRR